MEKMPNKKYCRNEIPSCFHWLFFFHIFMVLSLEFVPLKGTAQHCYYMLVWSRLLPSQKLTASLKIWDNTASLKIWNNTASLKIRDKTASLKIWDNTASLKIRDNTASLKIWDNTASLKIWDNTASLTNIDKKHPYC